MHCSLIIFLFAIAANDLMTILDQTRPYKTIRNHTGSYGTIHGHTGSTGPYRAILCHTGQYGAIQGYMGPYGAIQAQLFVKKIFYEFLVRKILSQRFLVKNKHKYCAEVV